MIKDPKYIININTLNIDNFENEISLSLFGHGNNIDYEFDKENNIYNIFEISYNYNNSTYRLDPHFYYDENKKILFRYDFYKVEITEYEINFIKTFMPHLYKFINYNNINNVTLKIATEIRHGFLDCKTRNIIEGFIDESHIYVDLLSIIKILALLQLFYNNEDEIYFNINKFLLKDIIDKIYNKQITLDIINKIIEKKMFSKFQNIVKLSFSSSKCKNDIILEHNSEIMNKMYESQFIYTLINLKDNVFNNFELAKLKEG
jgi:hypothetical protein